jgi:hypothetical protein
MEAVNQVAVDDRDHALVAGDECAQPIQVQPVRGGELDRRGAGDLLSERPDVDAIPVDDGADRRARPDDVAVLQVAVGPSVRPVRVVVGWPGGGVAVDKRDPLVEQVDHGGVERSAGSGCRCLEALRFRDGVRGRHDRSRGRSGDGGKPGR